MSVALTVVAAPIALLVLLLAVPVDLAFRFEGLEAFKGRITVRWLFGLVRFRVRVPGARRTARAPKAKDPSSPEARTKRRKRGSPQQVLAVLRQAAFRSRVYQLLGDLFRAARLRELGLRMRLGLGDPADTGRLWAFIGPLGAVAGNLRNAEVRIEPEFVDPVFEFEARGRMRPIPLQLLALLIAFALSPPSIRAWRTMKGRDA